MPRSVVVDGAIFYCAIDSSLTTSGEIESFPNSSSLRVTMTDPSKCSRVDELTPCRAAIVTSIHLVVDVSTMLNSSTGAARMFVITGRHCRRTAAARPFSSIATADDNHTSNINSDAIAVQQKNPYYPQMFTPLFLGSDIGSLPNRVIMGSMHTGLEGHSIPSGLLWAMNACNDDHHDMTKMAMYFEERAKGGVGLMGEFATTYKLLVSLSYAHSKKLR